MTRNTISTLLLIRRASHFVPLHSPDSADSLIFFSPESWTSTPQQGIYPERIKSSNQAV